MSRTIIETPTYLINETFQIGQHNYEQPDFLVAGHLNMDTLFRTVEISPSDQVMPLNNNHSLDVNTLQFNDPLLTGRMINGDTLLNRRLYNDALLVMHKGQVVHESYRNGMLASDRHVIHSCTKSLCAMIALMAVDENILQLDKPVREYLPEFSQHAAWQHITVQHLLNMQAGIEYSEDYANPDAQYWDYSQAAGYYPTSDGQAPIGVKAWVTKNLSKQNAQPGTTFVYNSTLTNVLGMVLEVVYNIPLADLFEQKLYTKVGTANSAHFNTDPQGFPIVEGQFNTTLQDFARLASLMINHGKNYLGEQILPVNFFESIHTPDSHAQQAYRKHWQDPVFLNGQYKNKFWVTEPDKKRFTMLGIHGQFAWCDLDAQLLIVGMGSYPKADGNLMMSVLKTLWDGIAQQLSNEESL